jgi:hypothetical protein
MAIFKAIEENTLPTEAARSRRAEPRHQTTVVGRLGVLARVDGFDQDKAESKRDERAVILRRLLTSKCDTFEALEFADRLFDACPRLVKCFWKEGGHVFGVGSIRSLYQNGYNYEAVKIFMPANRAARQRGICPAIPALFGRRNDSRVHKRARLFYT